ncbi:oxidoreductase [Streptomyces sp. NBC_00887]|uniref:oxidoreductase n=1 Tax=Streptomyces sp. NBC_00887 TaxID=2975859 RepID=UPI00386BBAF5|nr:oxidoreductase [Streptomyces sp. NBC_00887]
MSAQYSTFGLAPAIRAGGVLADGGYQAHRDFMDFIVDGRPLLFQLSDLDAVSPLASDVPPAIFATHVRRLLLDADAPLADGRYVIYGCPECESLACGAVTAVIERDGTDVVWRDFAWQTYGTVDLERGGYHGIGPFRFDGEQYRTELEQLLPADDTTDAQRDGPAARRRVLLIGARVAVLAKLAAALRTIGTGADITQDAAGVPAAELRGYGAVVFGRAVTDAERTAVREAFGRAGADVAYVDGTAPVIPLLVARIENALDRTPPSGRRLLGLTVTDGTACLEVSSTCRVSLVAYRLDLLHRTRTDEVFDGVLAAGEHRIPLGARVAEGRSALVARSAGSVLIATVDP